MSKRIDFFVTEKDINNFIKRIHMEGFLFLELGNIDQKRLVEVKEFKSNFKKNIFIITKSKYINYILRSYYDKSHITPGYFVKRYESPVLEFSGCCLFENKKFLSSGRLYSRFGLKNYDRYAEYEKEVIKPVFNIFKEMFFLGKGIRQNGVDFSNYYFSESTLKLTKEGIVLGG